MLNYALKFNHSDQVVSIMPRSCVICGTVSIHFSVHSFPTTDPMVRNEWLSFIERHGIDRNRILRTSRLCSRHFSNDDFSYTAVRRRLNREAIPRDDVLPAGAQIIEVGIDFFSQNDGVGDGERQASTDVPVAMDISQNFIIVDVTGEDVNTPQELSNVDGVIRNNAVDDGQQTIAVRDNVSPPGAQIIVVGGDFSLQDDNFDGRGRQTIADERVAMDISQNYIAVDVAVEEGDVRNVDEEDVVLVFDDGAIEDAGDDVEGEDLTANIVVVEELIAARVCAPAPDRLYVGQMDRVCPDCYARHFVGELFICCGSGKVLLTGDRELGEVPQMLRRLLSEDGEENRHFQREVRQYNNAMAFASLVAQDFQAPPGRGPRTFVIHGQTYHLISDADAGPNAISKNCQLYFVDTLQATEDRMRNPVNQACRPNLLESLDILLRGINPYARMFMHMKEVHDWERAMATAENPPRPPRTVSMHFVCDSRDPGRRNQPTVREIAAVFAGNDGAPPENVDFVVYDRNPNAVNFRRMPSTSRHADPMLYPLFFPNGECGWATQMPHEGPRRTAVRHNVSVKEYSCYRLAVRYDGRNEPTARFSTIHSGRFLLQQYVCDLYVRVEASRLCYLRNHQNELHADSYRGLMDHLTRDDVLPGDQQNVGRRVILPSSFAGSPRSMQQNYQDSMAIVRRFGKPDLFITFTCNPRWPEIVENLPRGVTASDRPDLVARVFNLKLRDLMRDIVERNIFGKVEAFVYVVEFQKRGLPHAHILVILQEMYKPKDAEDVDRLIRAEIPDPDTDRELYNIVVANMMHGPCGILNPQCTCMVDGRCSKDFPKAFSAETQFRSAGGYPAYKRRDNGRTVLVRGRELGNESVVPYNPYLLLKYDAHINVEACSTVKSVMYLYKYVHKGHDVATIRVRSNDEIQRFIDTRYVSAPEAVWRLFSFHMQDRSHVIVRLAVHLEGMHNVFFRPGELIRQVERAAQRDTTLTAYFHLNAADPEARRYLYHEVPNHYCWNASTTTWTRRKTNTGARVIGRMYSVSPLDRQRFFLRLLLLYRRGCVSFDDLKTIDGVHHLTYEAAAVALGLLEDDAAWGDCLAEASRHDTPRQVRALFAIICVYCLPANPLELYSYVEAHLMADYSREHPENRARAACLNAINQLLGTYGKSLGDFGLPIPDVLEEPLEAVYDAVQEAERGDVLLRQLNVDQRAVYDRVMTAVLDSRPSAKVFFVNGPGGTGKTMLYSCLMSVLRGQSKSVLAVAFTGIAATLLDGGRTVHSTFGLPFETLTYESTSTVKLQSRKAHRIRDASLIVWDEAPMSPGFQLTVVDRLLKSIMQSDLPFGGKPFLFGGDFRQVLPVVPHGIRSDIVGACIKSNELWPVMQQFTLTRNMRADGDREFAAWLLLLGNGNVDRYGDDENTIQVPRRFLSRGPLADFVFPEMMCLRNYNSYANKVILCPTNEGCRMMNDSILRNRLEGEVCQYLSTDTIECDDPEVAADFPIEFVHSLHPTGLPPHNLVLKVGAIVMLLRNLDAQRGLCNGTRMVIIELRRLNFRARLLNGTEQEDIIVPRIPLISTDEDGLPFKLRRVQFPVKLAFSMTINKSQGQTFDRVGIYLPSPVFTHGQLYVAFSRVRSAEAVKIEIPSEDNRGAGVTKNIVFREVL